jgi:hypothetical protein
MRPISQLKLKRVLARRQVSMVSVWPPPKCRCLSFADGIEKLDRLKKSGSITDQEFAKLRAKLVQ